MTGGLTMLPTKQQTRETLRITPLQARVLLAGLPKCGKTTLLSEWAPKTTLIIDTHKGTTLLPGDHYVQHVSTWQQFEETVDLIVTGRHEFKTIGIDLIDDIYKLADLTAAQRYGGKVAAGTVEFGKGTAEAEGLFRQAVGKLLASPHGIWFLSHTDTEDNQGQPRYVSRLDKRVRTYVEGACHYLILAEILGARRQLRTAPSARFQAGGRTPLSDPMPLAEGTARQLYGEVAAGLSAPATAPARPAENKEKMW